MKTSSRIRISVILPVYNGENYLEQAINSVLRQDHSNVELIVVDDGSTDDTANIVKKCAPNALYIHQSNRGLGASRNTGVRKSTGEYLAFIDHDDLWSSDKLSTQLGHLSGSESKLHLSPRQVSTTIASFRSQKSSGPVPPSNKTLEPLVFSHVQQFLCPSLSEAERFKLRIDAGPVPGYIAGTLLLRKATFTKVGPFWEKHDAGEFIDWFMRAKDKGIPMLMCPEVHYQRRIHLTNMGRQTKTYDRRGYLTALKSSLDRRRASQSGEVATNNQPCQVPNNRTFNRTTDA